jgi:hypothetical protein
MQSGYSLQQRRGVSPPRRGIGRELAWLVLAKLVALALLWFLFFTPENRPHVNGAATSQRLGIDRTGTDTQEIGRD